MDYHFATDMEALNALAQLMFDALVLCIAVPTPGLSQLYIEAKVLEFFRDVYKKGNVKLPATFCSHLFADFIGIDVALMVLGSEDVSLPLAWLSLTCTVPAHSNGCVRAAGTCYQSSVHSAPYPHSAWNVRPAELPVPRPERACPATL